MAQHAARAAVCQNHVLYHVFGDPKNRAKNARFGAKWGPCWPMLTIWGFLAPSWPHLGSMLLDVAL